MLVTLDEFVKKYDGKFLEVAGSANAKNQCVDAANGYIRDVLGFPIIEHTNAQDFPKKASTNFTYIQNTPSGVPERGDLVIFSSKDGVGHISIFLGGNTISFESFDQNFPTGSPCKVVGHNYKNVLGWMRPVKNLSEEFQDITQKVTQEALDKMRLERDSNWNQYMAAFAEADELRAKYEQSQKELIDFKTRVIEAEGVADARKNALEDYSELLKCEANIESIRESIKTAISREYEASKEVIRLGEYVENLEQKHKQEVDALLNEIAEWKIKLMAEAEKNQKQAETFEQRIEQIQKDAVQNISFSTLVQRLVNNFKKLG